MPLFHFLLIGIALFVVHDQVAAPNRASMSIVVREELVDQLAREYEARWTRKASGSSCASRRSAPSSGPTRRGARSA